MVDTSMEFADEEILTKHNHNDVLHAKAVLV